MEKQKIIKIVDGDKTKEKYVNPLEALSIVNSYNRTLNYSGRDGFWKTTEEYKRMDRGETMLKTF